MKSHKFDPWSFIGGLTLLLFGLVVLIPDSSSMVALRLDSILGYFLPAAALAIGVALVIPALRRARAGRDEPQVELTPPEREALEELSQTTPPMA